MQCSGREDEFMDEIPTVVVDPLPAEYQHIAMVGAQPLKHLCFALVQSSDLVHACEFS
jgi:hypothetical protein